MSTLGFNARLHHDILYDFHNRTNPDGSSTITLDRKEYRAIKNQHNHYSVIRTSHPVFHFFNSLFGSPGKNTEFIARTLNANKQSKFEFDAQANEHGIDSICFSGGGAKGIAYYGVLEQLGDKKLKQVTQVSGASAGALTAVFVAIGLSVKEIKNTFKEQSIELNQKVIESNLKKKMCDALGREPYRSHLKEIFKKNIVENSHIENITFSQLELLRKSFSLQDDIQQNSSLKQLFMSASFIDEATRCSFEVTCSSDKTPNLPIVQAALASAALPIYLDPVEVNADQLGPDFARTFSEKMVRPLIPNSKVKLRDGGLHNNLPHDYLTSENKLLLAFQGNKEIHKRSLNFSEKIKQFLCGVPVYENRQVTHERADRYGVVYLPVPVSVTDVKTAKDNMKSITYQTRKNVHYSLAHERNQPVQPALQQIKNEEVKRKVYVGNNNLMGERTHGIAIKLWPPADLILVNP